MDAQLGTLFGLHQQAGRLPSSPSALPGARHTLVAHTSPSQIAPTASNRSARNRSRSYHIDPSAEAPVTRLSESSPRSPTQARSPASPFSKLRNALTDVIDRSRRLRVRHRDHLQPQTEASSSRSPSRSPNLPHSPTTSSQSPSSRPISPATQLGVSALEPATPLNLNASTTSFAPRTSDHSYDRHNHDHHDHDHSGPDAPNETILMFMNKRNQPDSDHDTDQDVMYSPDDLTLEQPTTSASEIENSVSAVEN
eukprot:c11889_g1_i4.p1 GENE.c11889_g1_i4~~c11889_g1_i4.p1  ORF type:complete len:253 (-),score=30.85 c11889_g1_i4:364-1122(-)